MAGSYKHCCNDDGSFRDADFTSMIENLGDAWEACEEMHWMIQHLAGGDKAKIKRAVDSYYAHARGERDGMTLKVTVTKEVVRVLDSKEVETTDIDATLDEMVMECNRYGAVVDVQKEQLA